MMKVDLHLHSNTSDGSDTLEELIEIIQAEQINVFALTDHDTIAACKDMQKLVPDGIKFINAIELTCKTDNIKSHILGYNCNPDDKTLNDLIEKGKKLRKQKLDVRIKHLKDVWDIELTKDEWAWLNSIKSVVKTHLGVILVNRKLANNNIEAMDKYLDCKTGNTRFDVLEAIRAIEISGGIPVWAHPLGGEGEIHLTKEEFLIRAEKMISWGIKGLECFYSRYTKDEIEFLLDFANSNNLLISAGSDYHGKNKTVEIGKLSVDDFTIDYSKITLLKALGL